MIKKKKRSLSAKSEYAWAQNSLIKPQPSILFVAEAEGPSGPTPPAFYGAQIQMPPAS
jgi:hypothetical protein